MAKIFLDASYAIALSSPRDKHHKKALKLATELEIKNHQMVTTHAVVLEIGNSLAKFRFREAAIELIDSIENDPSIEIVPVTTELYKRGFELFKKGSSVISMG